MVDCSHANSAKQHARQEEVWRSLIQQRLAGNQALIGVMVESYLKEGNQPFPRPVNELVPGVSITDACIGWEMTERMLRSGAEELAKAHAPAAAGVP
jgi:3-deoxy-7-phosphoheptulonate synthase